MSEPAATAESDPDEVMVEAQEVSKFFGDIVAVSNVSFRLGPGVTALLGPNGAGKSTVLRMLSGQSPPSSGSLRVLGRDPRSSRSLTSEVGLVPQQEKLFEHLRAHEVVRFIGELHGVDDAAEVAAHCLAIVELDPDDTRPVAAYSKGMRQRVKLAQALVHSPRVLLLDEPLTGLDPRQRRTIVDLVRSLGAEGRCVVVSSHLLDEVQRFGSDVIVIAQGRLAAEGDFHAIRALMDDRPRRIRIGTDRPAELTAGLFDAGVVVAAELDADGTIVDTIDAGALSRAIAPVALTRDALLHEVVPIDEDLEAVFRYLVQS